MARLLELVVGACVFPPLALGWLLGAGPAVITTVIGLSAPAYAAFFLAGRSLLARQSAAVEARAAWGSLRWDLAGGAALLNLTFLEYFSAVPAAVLAPVQMAVIVLTDIVVLALGVACVEFVRTQLLGRRGGPAGRPGP